MHIYTLIFIIVAEEQDLQVFPVILEGAAGPDTQWVVHAYWRCFCPLYDSTVHVHCRHCTVHVLYSRFISWSLLLFAKTFPLKISITNHSQWVWWTGILDGLGMVLWEWWCVIISMLPSTLWTSAILASSWFQHGILHTYVGMVTWGSLVLHTNTKHPCLLTYCFTHCHPHIILVCNVLVHVLCIVAANKMLLQP